MLSWVREKIAEGRLRWQQSSQQVCYDILREHLMNNLK